MCGFIGYIVSKSSKNSAIYKNKFNYFFNKQKYRGPDFNESFLLNSNDTTICVGFNRLSIFFPEQGSVEQYALPFNHSSSTDIV